MASLETEAQESDAAGLPPLSDEELTEQQRGFLANAPIGPSAYATRVMIRHPARYPVFADYAREILLESTLPATERQLIILRTCHLCDGQYGIQQHRKLAKRVGVPPEEIEQVFSGPGAFVCARKAALLVGVDEYVRDNAISAEVFAVLRGIYSDAQMIDYLLLIGWYITISSTYNSLKIPLQT